ncbi:unnamed protein product, partial [Mesorhabditis belari]|uniref:Uncharacterized protein n=1 Tax=Mesorhabditis belari TaxID=2138241 RepID=A0AAF3EJI1_9BILA
MYLLFAVLVSHALPAILSLPICTECPTGGIWSRWRDTTDCTKRCGLNAKSTTTTATYGCDSCTLAQLLAIRRPPSPATFTPVFSYDSVTGCAQVSGNCSGSAVDVVQIGGSAVAGQTGFLGYVCGCGWVSTKPEAPFVCSPAGKWQFGGETLGDWYCYVYASCPCSGK